MLIAVGLILDACSGSITGASVYDRSPRYANLLLPFITILSSNAMFLNRQSAKNFYRPRKLSLSKAFSFLKLLKKDNSKVELTDGKNGCSI
jgi:hypothetical protein